MWRDWKPRAKEILEYATVFKRERYYETTRRLEVLAAKMADKREFRELESDMEEVFATFGSEFSSGGPSYAQLLSFVEPIMKFYYGRQDLQSKFGSLIEDLARNSRNLIPIDEPFRGTSGGTRFYGKCFLYLINAEGMFDEAVTLLYGLFLDWAGKGITVAELHRTPFKTIQAEMLKAKAPDAVFEGWLCGHVRNAIAHCRFFFDETKRSMSFREKPQESGKEWHRSFNADEFDEIYRKLNSVWHVISHLKLLWRVADLVLRSDVLGAGTLPPIGQPMR